MTKRKKTNKEPEIQKLLLKGEDQLYFINIEDVEKFSSSQALAIALATKIEIRHQLMVDAQSSDHYVQDIKVVDGLSNGLNKLFEIFPHLEEQVDSLEIRPGGKRIFIS